MGELSGTELAVVALLSAGACVLLMAAAGLWAYGRRPRQHRRPGRHRG